MPTIDLSTARVGSEVTTHAGAKLVIERCEPNEWGIKFWFSGYTGWFIYQPDGAMSHAPCQNPMNIIAISPPPMSDAERLVENVARFIAIAAIIKELDRRLEVALLEQDYFDYGDARRRAESVIAIAEGRTP